MIKRFMQGSSLLPVMMALASPAFAQGASTEQPKATTTGAGEIGEIIVTAQRFNESAQKTSLAISVMTPDQLKGVVDLKQLQNVDPGIQLGQAGTTTQAFIRGSGALNNTAYAESSVAFNLDGVYLYTSTMVTPLMYDLARIEVLKGPQGTLYGRNASTGAINLISVGAKLGTTEGYIEGQLGNYDLRRVTGAVNVPLTSNLAVRVAGLHTEHSGYLSDGTDDQDLTAGRIRVLWEPSDRFKVQLGADVSKADSTGPGSSVSPNPTNDKYVGALDPRLDTGPFFLGGYSLSALPPYDTPYFKDDQWSVHAQVDADLGFANLTVLPAYRFEKLSYRDYVPGFEDFQKPTSKQKSIEVRLANQYGKSKWVVGGYYFKIDQDIFAHIRNESLFQNVVVNQNSHVESYALFGEGTYAITDQFRVIGGLRYSHDVVGTTGSSNALLGAPVLPPQSAEFNPFDPVNNPTGDLLDYVIDKGARGHAVTWKVGAEYDVSPDSLLFATASKGFKGGGAYNDLPTLDSSFRPEYVTAFEVGSRNRFFGNTLQLNVEGFYWKVKDQQIPYPGFNSQNQVVLRTDNAGKIQIYGANLDMIWRATPNDTFHVGVEYLHAKYDDFTRVLPSAAVLTTTACKISGYGGPQSLAPATVDCAGLPGLRAPRWSVVASYERHFDLGSNGEIVFNGDLNHTSSRYITPAFTPLMLQKATTLFNASLQYTFPNKALSLTVWGRNLSNQRVMTGGEQFNDFFSRPALMAPRTYGVTAKYAF